MQGDLKKAPQMPEARIQDMEHLQQAMWQESSSSKDEPEGEPAPEVVAVQKQLTSLKFAYMVDQQRAAMSNNP